MGVKTCIKGVVWEWQDACIVDKSVNVAGPEEVFSSDSMHGMQSISQEHAELDRQRRSSALPSSEQPAMEVEGQQTGSSTEASGSNAVKEGGERPRIRNVLSPGQQGLHPALRGGAKQPGRLAGGSGQDIAAMWQSATEDIAAALRQCAEDFTRMQPINIERHGFANLHQSDQWRRVTQLTRDVQSELLLFAQERTISEGGLDRGPPMKRARYTAEQESSYRIQPCNLLVGNSRKTCWKRSGTEVWPWSGHTRWD